ncbi:unnamed protein product, partial [Iphiclides podalirius]
MGHRGAVLCVLLFVALAAQLELGTGSNSSYALNDPEEVVVTAAAWGGGAAGAALGALLAAALRRGGRATRRRPRAAPACACPPPPPPKPPAAARAPCWTWPTRRWRDCTTCPSARSTPRSTPSKDYRGISPPFSHRLGVHYPIQLVP